MQKTEGNHHLLGTIPRPMIKVFSPSKSECGSRGLGKVELSHGPTTLPRTELLSDFLPSLLGLLTSFLFYTLTLNFSAPTFCFRPYPRLHAKSRIKRGGNVGNPIERLLSIEVCLEHVFLGARGEVLKLENERSIFKKTTGHYSNETV
jgi:hypothetical protein